jgi:ribosomal protein L29
MVGEAFAGLSAIKAAFDIAKGLKDIDDVTRRNAAIIELQEELLAAQTAQSELTHEVGELKKEVADLKTWEAEKQRYELKKFGHGFAYIVKPDAQGTEPLHQICANCYARGKKSFLASVPTNQARMALGMGIVYRCSGCKAEI